MANQVEILSLNIDNQQLLKRLAETKKQIDELQASQKQLTTEGQTSSQQFVQQAATLKNLSSQYTTQQNVVAQLNKAKEDAVNVADAVNQALHQEIVSIQGATENNKTLIAVRNQLNASTEEGAAAIELLNEKINQNTEFIKANVSAGEQQKMNIGNYSEAFKEAFANINPLNGGISGFVARSKEAGGAGNLLTESFKGMTVGIGGMIKAGLAFIATPIGAAIAALAVVIGVVVGAFKFMSASMNSTEEGSNKLAKVTATITGVFNGFWKLIKPLGEFIGNAFIKYFELASAAVEKAVGLVSKGLKLLGFDDASKSVDEWSNSIKGSVKDAQALAQAEAQLNKSQREAEKVQLDYQKRAEKLRQLRDDESKTIAQRVAANTELGRVLKEQLNAELAIANQALKVAQLRIKAEGATKENLDAQAEALTKISDINERVTGQESEQLANLNSLRKEAADAEKERQAKALEAKQKAVDKAIQLSKDEIDKYIASQGIKKKSMEEELAFEEELSKKKLAVLEKEFKAGKMSKASYEAAKLGITNDFAKKQVDVAVANAQAELDNYKAALAKKKQDDGFFTQAKLDSQVAENNALLQKETEFQQLRLEKGLINQKEYNDAVNALNEANRIANEQAQTQRDEAEKARKAIDLENQQIVDEEKFVNDFQVQQSREDIRYQAELEAAKKNGANLELIEQKHAIASQKISEQLEQAKLSSAQSTFGELASLLGENTEAGKAAAIASATINTYAGVTQVWRAESLLPEPIATIQKLISTGTVLASGLGAVKKITSTKVPSRAGGGIIPRLNAGLISNGSNLAIPLSNGDDTLAYVGQGELILNREQQRRAGGATFFRSLGVPGFANGGLVGGNTNLGQLGGIKLDTKQLAQEIGQEVGRANKMLPAPQVEVSQISEAQSTVNRINVGASL